MNASLGNGATGIFGGEKQRLAITRALLRGPAILILGESTSALDLPTETALFKGRAEYREEITMILVSHRLRSLIWVDLIVMLDYGAIAGEGDHRKLYSTSALYRDLYERTRPPV